MGNIRYLLSNKNIQTFDYELLYISKSKYENDWHSTAHFHPFTEIFFIIDGQGSFFLDDTMITVNQWDLVVINPNCLHTEKSVITNKPLEYIVLGIDNFSLDFTKTYSLINNEDNKKLFDIMNLCKNKDSILTYLNSLIHEIKYEEFNYEIACKSILNLFITEVVRSVPSLLLANESEAKVNLECLKIKNYIDAHYSENITLDDLSNLSFVNKYHLVHTFTKQIGVSPINYVINKRISESKNLLSTTNYSIRDIACIVGFSNSSYFSQMFKKIVGLSPRTFRLNKSEIFV